jgi:hypothetical protein
VGEDEDIVRNVLTANTINNNEPEKFKDSQTK